MFCIVCEGTFFPSLLEEMSQVVGFFNERAQKLLELHLSSGVTKCITWLKDKLQGNHVVLIQEGRDLVTYAIINAIAIRKILKKYDKVHLHYIYTHHAYQCMYDFVSVMYLCCLNCRFTIVSKAKHSSRKPRLCT